MSILRSILFVLCFTFSSVSLPASLQVSRDSCGPIAYALISVMDAPYTKEYQQDQVLKSKLPKREEEFWIQLLDDMFARKGTPEEFATEFYTKCMENNGYINLGDKT